MAEFIGLRLEAHGPLLVQLQHIASIPSRLGFGIVEFLAVELNGALLDEAGKQRMREISEQMSVMGPEFSKNVKKSSEAFALIIEDEKDLAGLPQNAIDAAVLEAEERDFWLTHDTTDYVDWSKAKKVTFPNLKPTTQSISLRLPLWMLDSIKTTANRQDVPYQSLIKVWLNEKRTLQWINLAHLLFHENLDECVPMH